MTISQTVQNFTLLHKAVAMLTRRLDSALGGISLSELAILYTLSISPDQTLRRTDLAEQLGFTASGVTRLLLPMEKIGLIKKVVDPSDARVSLVSLAPGGRQKLVEGVERAELFADGIVGGDPGFSRPAFQTSLSQLIQRLK